LQKAWFHAGCRFLIEPDRPVNKENNRSVLEPDRYLSVKFFWTEKQEKWSALRLSLFRDVPGRRLVAAKNRMIGDVDEGLMQLPPRAVADFIAPFPFAQFECICGI
jgi:hypothetical protein